MNVLPSKTSQSLSDSTTYQFNYSYEQISDKKILWNDVFSQQEVHYFVYFYSLTCSYCEQLKNKIILYSLTHNDIYFIQANASVIINDKNEVPLGINSVEKLFIKGYPSLIEIDNKILQSYYAGIKQISSKLSL